MTVAMVPLLSPRPPSAMSRPPPSRPRASSCRSFGRFPPRGPAPAAARQRRRLCYAPAHLESIGAPAAR
eukprot:5822431-Prymnesium_polylepis.1